MAEPHSSPVPVLSSKATASACASHQPRAMETTESPSFYKTPSKYLCIHPAQSTGSDLHFHIVVSGGRKVLLGQIHSCYIRQWMCPQELLQLLKALPHFLDCFVGRTGSFFQGKEVYHTILNTSVLLLLLLLLLLLS